MGKLLVGLISFSLISCVPFISGEKSKYSKPTDVLKEDSYESAAQVGPVFVGKLKPVTRKISGRVYCGEGLSQRPANKATIELVIKNKTIKSTTSEVDGSYFFSASFELDGEYSFLISARCGKATAKLPSDLTNDLLNQDFWIK